MSSRYRILIFITLSLLAAHSFFLSPPSSRGRGRGKANEILDNNKVALLREISKSNKKSESRNRDSILNAIEELEKCTDSPIAMLSLDGEWSLVYSSQVKNMKDAYSLVDKISAVLYKVFFKIAPFLAGGQAGGITSSLVKSSNKQYIDVSKGTISNTVLLKFGDTLMSKISVDGLIYPIQSSINTNDASVQVVFTDFAIRISDKVPWCVRIPLPSVTGDLVTTFCDRDVRVSRGGRGGVFVAKRL